MIINPYRFTVAAPVFPVNPLIDYNPASANYAGFSNTDSVLGLDSSGNGNDSLDTADHRPQYRLDTKCNGYNVFQFQNDHSGSSLARCYWNLPNVFSSLTSGEAYFVYKLGYDPTTMNELGSGLSYFGTAGSVNVFPYKDGNIYDDFGSTTRQGFSSGGNSNYHNKWVLYSVKANSSFQKAYYNNTLLNNFASNSFAFRTTPQIGWTASNYFFSGYLARFLFFGSALSDADSLSVRNYLIDRYALL